MRNFSSVIRAASNSLHTIKGLAKEPSIRRTISVHGASVGATCDYVVFFADPVRQIYQLQQWVRPLEALAARGKSVALVVMDPFVGRNLVASTTLPILLTRSMDEYSSFLLDKSVRVVFYVNNSQSNFTSLRETAPLHVHLNHGESDKVSMVSNQLKAYDFAFVAGDAAVERIVGVVRRFEPNRLVRIGRPQLDRLNPIAQEPTPGRIKVLYAPTWEGDSPRMAYSSISSMGVTFVKTILADPRFSLAFRPHPKTGMWSKEAKDSLQEIKSLLARANSLAPHSNHHLDISSDATNTLMQNDVIVADNSAMTMDAVGLDKPVFLVVTAPLLDQSSTSASIKRTLESLSRILPDAMDDITDRLFNASFGALPDSQVKYRDHLFGPQQLGTGTDRFIAAAENLLDMPEKQRFS